MRSRAARLTFGAAAWLALGAAAFLLFRFETQIAGLGASVRAFDQRAREATDAVADLRVEQQAYVAAGQGVTFWMATVASTSESISASLTALRQSAVDAKARAAIDEAAATMSEVGDVDKRARDYITSGQQLMAADVIFTEGGAAAALAARQIDAARVAARVAGDASQATLRRQQALALGVGGLIAALVVLVLIPGRSGDTEAQSGLGLAAGDAARFAVPGPPVEAPGSHRSPELKVAAELVTDLGRVRDAQDFPGLLARAADLLDASGLMVWMGNSAGADLKPVLAHGYAPTVIARIPPVPRSANNAAAAAYRSGTLQIVLARPGSSGGAVVAPIISVDGCIGALSAEIRGGAETSESVQALAAIIAAQLANVVAAEPAAVTDAARAASL